MLVTIREINSAYANATWIIHNYKKVKQIESFAQSHYRSNLHYCINDVLKKQTQNFKNLLQGHSLRPFTSVSIIVQCTNSDYSTEMILYYILVPNAEATLKHYTEWSWTNNMFNQYFRFSTNWVCRFLENKVGKVVCLKIFSLTLTYYINPYFPEVPATS